MPLHQVQNVQWRHRSYLSITLKLPYPLREQGLKCCKIFVEYCCRNFFFYYCCSGTVVSIFLPPLSPTQPTPTSQPQSFPLLALSMGPLYMFPDDPSPSFPHYSLPLPLWLLSVCSLFQCLCLYFACLFCWLASTYR